MFFLIVYCISTVISPLIFYPNVCFDQVWDAGVALTNKGVNITGFGVLGIAIICALGLASL